MSDEINELSDEEWAAQRLNGFNVRTPVGICLVPISVEAAGPEAVAEFVGSFISSRDDSATPVETTELEDVSAEAGAAPRKGRRSSDK